MVCLKSWTAMILWLGSNRVHNMSLALTLALTQSHSSISSHSCRARPRRCPANSSSVVHWFHCDVRINAGSQSWNLISVSSPSIGGALPLLLPVLTGLRVSRVNLVSGSTVIWDGVVSPFYWQSARVASRQRTPLSVISWRVNIWAFSSCAQLMAIYLP